MNTSEKNSHVNPADYQANERTFLAWIRTGIGIMAFGFVVVKFSLFIKQLAVLLQDHPGELTSKTNGYSGILGILLVAIGTLTIVLGYIRYLLNNKALAKGAYRHSSLTITLLTIFVFCISLALIVYLLHSI